MPALADVFRPHAHAYTRTYFVTGHGSGKEIPPVHATLRFDYGEKRRQHDRPNVQHPLSVDIVELESLNLTAINQSCVRR
jgi:hypothetical protein